MDQRALPPKRLTPAPDLSVVDMRGKLPTRTRNRDGSAPEPYRRRSLAGLRGGTVHYTGGSSGSDVVSIAAYQVGPNVAASQPDFPAIAYTYYVDVKGTVFWCHDLEVRVWHSDGPYRNDTYIGVCYAGSYEPNPAQIAGIALAFAHAERLLGRPLSAIEGHRQASQTSCPGPTLEHWLPAVVDALEGLGER